jgi:hypothetical protein
MPYMMHNTWVGGEHNEQEFVHLSGLLALQDIIALIV